MKFGIFGPQGSGKTFLAIYMARILQKRFAELSIFTNVVGKNGDPYFKTITDLADFPFEVDEEKDATLDYQWRSPKIMIVDESMFSMSSRGSGSNINELWSRAFAFFRKNNVVATFFCTHRPSMLDVRFRDQLDVAIMCRKNPSHFDYLYYDLVTQINVPFIVPRNKKVFEFANYNTYSMPMPIEVVRLAEHPLFELKRIERKKVKANAE